MVKGIDLNTKKISKISIFSDISEVNHTHRKACLRPGNGTPANEGFSPLRANLQWKSQGQIVQLSGSIYVHGLCPTDLSGEPPRDRDLPSSTARMTTIRKATTVYRRVFDSIVAVVEIASPRRFERPTCRLGVGGFILRIARLGN